MGIKLESITIESPEEVAKVQEAKRREKVKDLIPLAQKIKEATTRVTFSMDTEGANGELDRLRDAANLEGYSLRILNREVDPKDKKITRVTVKTGKLIERETGKKDETADPTSVELDAPEAAPEVKGAKSK